MCKYGHSPPLVILLLYTVSFEDWLGAFWLNCFPNHALAHFPLTSLCTSCQCLLWCSLVLWLTCTLPFFFFLNVADWHIQTNPNQSLMLEMVDGAPKTYWLCMVIYHGRNHWTLQWITFDGHVWGHDGQKHKGRLQSEGKMVEHCGRSKFCSLRAYDSHTLSIPVYALDC